MAKKNIVLCTTVPETLDLILRRQPHFLNQHFDVSLVTSPAVGVNKIASREGVAVHPVPMKRGIKPAYDLYSLFCMALALRKIRADLIHSYTPKAGLIAMLTGWLCRVPVRVHTFTGLIFPTTHGFKKKLLIWVDCLICACATHVVPEGLGVKNDLKHFRITGKTLNVIGHGNIAGVDTTYYSAIAEGIDAAASDLKVRLAIDPKEFVFCFVGRLNKDKGLAELMQAFAALPHTAHLLLVGGVDQTAPVSTDLLTAIDSHPRVHVLGFLEDVRPALRSSDVLVLPSYREGFPNVLLQAGAMALPVIASDVNGCNEVIEEGFNGWLVRPRDPLGLQIAMLRAMEISISARKEMGMRAKTRIQERFEQKQHWERMLDFYQGLLDAR